MGYRHRRDRQARPPHRLPGLEHSGRHKRVARLGKLEKIGPDPAIEDVAMEKVEHILGAEHLHAVWARPVDIFQKDRQRGDVDALLRYGRCQPAP